MISRIIRNSLCILLSLYVALWPVSSISQTATLLPNGMQQFFDNNGNPLSSGTVDFYIPSTTTRKNTWQDAAETIVNTNPVLLDGAGRALIYGDGSYRQVLKDSSLNLIWDKIVSSYANGGTIITTGDGDQVGTIKPWAGILAPNQYAFANGQEISRTTFALLFTAITQTLSVACTNSSATITGLVDTTQIPFGAKVELSCVPPGTTVTNKTTTTITLSAPSNVTLNTTATFFPFGNGNGTTTFNIPDLRGYVVAGRPNMGGTASTNLTATFFGSTPNAIGATGGIQSSTLISSNLPPYTPSGTVALGYVDPGHFHTTTAVPSNPGLAAGGAAQFSGGTATAINSDTKTTGITFSPSFAGAAQGGTSTAFANIQPTITLNYIIKITPDSSAQQASGVASLGGQVGAIGCISGILCTGNNVQIDTSFILGLVPPAGAWTNTRLPKTSAYPAVSADCNNTIALGGAAFYALTINAASGYIPTCAFFVINEDTGRAKTLSISGVSSPCQGGLLYPLETAIIYNDNNNWMTLCRSRTVSGKTFFINPSGNDAHDGLSTGAANAFATVAHCFSILGSYVQTFQGGNTCQLDNGTYSEFVTCFNSGGSEFGLAGNNSTPASVVWSGTIAIRDGCILGTGGYTLTNAGGPALSCTQGSTLDTSGPIIFSGSGVGIQSGIGCSNINILNNITFTTNYAFPFTAYNSGTLSINGVTVAMGAMTATDAFYIEGGHVVITSSSFTGTVTGGQWLMVNCGSINRGGATIPGSAGNPAVGAALTSSNCGGIQ